MNALAIAPLSASILPVNLTFANCVSSAIRRICQFTVQHFSFLSHLCLTGFGIKELASDYPFLKSKTERSARTDSVAQRTLKKIHKQNVTHTIVQGSLYLGSGIFGGIAAFQDFHLFDLGMALPILQGIGSGLFLFANFYSLERNIELFARALKLKDDKQYHALSVQIRTSAILGIISNIGYIISTIAAYFPPLQLMAIILGLFSIFVGSLKILIDFFYLDLYAH